MKHEKWEIKEFDAIRIDLGPENNCLLFGPKSEANARLIAAAPDLLAACIKAHDALLALHVCNQDKSFADEIRAFLHKTIEQAESEK